MVYLVYEVLSMERANRSRLIEQLRAPAAAEPYVSPAERYRDPAWLSREAALFQLPQIVGASAALAPGGCLPVDLSGRSALVVRADDGVARGFANACRHRASRLVDDSCTRKAIVCPYHGWTYDLRGTLVHVPHAEAFAGMARRDLHPLPVAERHGLVWLGDDVDAFLGELAGDLAAVDLAHG